MYTLGPDQINVYLLPHPLLKKKKKRLNRKRMKYQENKKKLKEKVFKIDDNRNGMCVFTLPDLTPYHLTTN